MTKTLYACRPKSNPSFMIVCDTIDGASFVARSWVRNATGLPIGDEIGINKHFDLWELITLTVEEDD